MQVLMEDEMAEYAWEPWMELEPLSFEEWPEYEQNIPCFESDIVM